jgi:hypothetical protein
MEVEGDLIEEIATNERGFTEAHHSDRRAKTVDRGLCRINWEGMREAVDAGNCQTAHRR